jgi:hypothetical protein
MDLGFALAFYDRWLDGWNQDDTSRLMDIVTDDFVLSSPTTRLTGMSVTSAEAIHEYATYIRRAYPDLIFARTGPPMFARDAPVVCFPWRGTGTFTGRFDPPGIAGTGKAFGFVGTETFTFRGDRACHLSAAYDLLRMMRQIGVLPGSWAPSSSPDVSGIGRHSARSR